MSDMAEFLEGVVGVVEATSFERLCLWKDNKARSVGPRRWEENLSGRSVIVGHLAGRPVNLELTSAIVDNFKIVFWYCCSQVVDHAMIDEWFKASLPKSCFDSSGYYNQTNAMNFCNVFPRVHQIGLILK